MKLGLTNGEVKYFHVSGELFFLSEIQPKRFLPSLTARVEDMLVLHPRIDTKGPKGNVSWYENVCASFQLIN